jgi:hypothetical protein
MYDPTLSLISQYVDGIFSIKDSSDSVYTDALSITSSDSQTVHKILLSYVVNKPNVNNILVFDNELLLSRPLENVADNEIKTFLDTFPPVWDLLILSPYAGTDLEDIPAYNIIKKATSMTTFHNGEYVYIASKQLMWKIYDTSAILNTYVYTRPFLSSSLKSTEPITDKYLIAEVMGIITASSDPAKISYEWRALNLSQ